MSTFRLLRATPFVVLFLALSSPAGADESWSVRFGTTTLTLDSAALDRAGISIEQLSEKSMATQSDSIVLDVGSLSDLGFDLKLGNVETIVDGSVVHTGSVTLKTARSAHAFDRPTIRSRVGAEGGIELVLQGHDAGPGLYLDRVKTAFDPDTGMLKLHCPSVRISEAMADALGNPGLNNLVIGRLTAEWQSEWVDGDSPYAAPRGGGGEPRAGTGPDMKFCQLYGLYQAGRLGSITGLSVATTSWNVGDEDLMWFAEPDTEHPFIVMNMYRLKSDRFEQIGQSWVKHGFYALGSTQCGTPCTFEPGHGPGDWLGTGCTDTYSAGLNASQNGLSPRSEVNPWTGEWTYAGSHLSLPNHSHNGIEHRIQVHDADLDSTSNPGATYYSEGYYAITDDTNVMNSAAWKPVTVSGVPGGTWTFGMTGASTAPVTGFAIDAWSGATQTVFAEEVPPIEFVSPDGRCILAAKATDLGDGTWHYEYALLNIDMDRKVKSVRIPTAPGTAITNVGFHAVDSHDEPYSNTSWDAVVSASEIVWSTTDNPLRWGTLYNFRFDASTPPNTEVTITLGLYEPGTPTTLSGVSIGPASFALALEFVGDPAPNLLPTCQTTDVVLRIQDGSEVLNATTPRLWYSYDGGAFSSSLLVPMGGDLYLATLPAPSCGDAVRYYFTAETTTGTSVSLPIQAVETNTYFLANVGFEETNTYLETNFETGLPAGWSLAGLWNISTTCSSVPTGACGDSDGSNVAYFGQTSTCNYDTGLRENASISTPAIALPASEQILLTYCSAFQRHLLAVGDWPEVRVLRDGQPTVVVDEPALGAMVGSPAIWEERVVDLTAFAGQTVTIAFNFDNLVPTNDDYLGWMIDNVSLRALEIDCIPGCGDAIRGGLLWDEWWEVNGAPAPTETHPLYPTIGQKSGSTTHRCKECHGWDYKGADGAYGSGSHYTGIGGVLGSSLTNAEMYQLIKFDTPPSGHGFSNYGLTDADILDLVAFLKNQVIDTDPYIDATGVFIGDLGQGMINYEMQGFVACSACHGPDGAAINFGTPTSPEWVGTIAEKNPWELFHKIRFGQPGYPMPSWLEWGGTNADAAAIGRYCQYSFPVDCLNESFCDDGDPCNGLELCVAGHCTPTTLNGDLNEDGVANGLDISLFVGGVLGESPDPVLCAHGDFSGNGVMDLDDLSCMVATLLGP
ncbi:MAG: hypothetical protein H6819_08305 [Phycisphaerales bacterium]|nr:hypothetical protein [Phycisphaerales bacterium]MCB9854193.1 hypothetical protein [Phycisphaerales bacterium]MCB9864270.1 hypothetical protein [Phycisphaerales bacterium]